MQFGERLAVPEAAREVNVPDNQQRLHHLFDKKGIAFGQVIQRLQEVAAHRPLQLKNRPQHRMDLVHGEGSEGALHHSPLAIQRGQEVSECRVDLFTAIGEQQQ